MTPIEIITIVDHGERRPMRLQRLDRGDGPIYVHHIFNCSYPNRWEWGASLEWTASCGRGPATWAYLFTFRDGTFGVCRVSDVNNALAALDARVDLSP